MSAPRVPGQSATGGRTPLQGPGTTVDVNDLEALVAHLLGQVSALESDLTQQDVGLTAIEARARALREAELEMQRTLRVP